MRHFDLPTTDDWQEIDAEGLAAPDELLFRHAGLPPGVEVEPRFAALADDARQWYRSHGRPWAAVRSMTIDQIDGPTIRLSGGGVFTSPLAARVLNRHRVGRAFVFAATAGAEVDERIAHLWQADRPDEAMFASAHAIALVEHLRATFADRLKAAATRQSLAVLPHYSPGYDGWDLADQAVLLQSPNGADLIQPPMRVLPSGGLIPMKSTLALFAATAAVALPEEIARAWSSPAEVPVAATQRAPEYAFPEKTLKLWRTKRLRLTPDGADALHANFHFDGSTCTSMGMPLAFDYSVQLQREADGSHRIVGCDCRPTADRPGYQSMCAYLDNSERFMSELAEYRPLVGRPLGDALAWDAPTSPAGCLCSRASQDHKWRAVFHTIHFALHGHETTAP